MKKVHMRSDPFVGRNSRREATGDRANAPILVTNVMYKVDHRS